MDVKRFEFLCHIADYGSFSKAASVIGVTQPSLGRQIRKLEDECGMRLLYRNGRGASLTPEGAQLLLRIRPLLKEIDSAISDLQAVRNSARGAVSIGMTPAVSRIIGYRLLLAAREKYPKINLNIVTGYSGYLLEWLASGRIDVGILDNERRADHLVFDHIAQLSLSLVSASAQARLAVQAGEAIDISALKNLPLVLPSRMHGLRRTMDIAAANAGISLNVTYEIDAHDLVREMVLAGAAHTVMCASAMQSEIERGELVATLLTPKVSTRLLCGTPSNRPVSAASRLIISLIKATLAETAGQRTGDISIDYGGNLSA